MTTKLFILVVSLFVLEEFSEALKLPSYFKTCSRNDPDIGACLLKNGKETLTNILNKGGDIQYNIPNFTPLTVKELNVNTSGFKLSFRDVEVSGLEGSILTNAKVDFKAKREEFEIVFPRFEVNGNYEISGRVLVLPIRGSGAANFTVLNLKVEFSHEYDLKKDKTGKEHLVTKNAAVQYQNTKVFIYLENLFGNKELSDNMNLVLNENSDEVVNEMGPVLAEVLGRFAEKIYNDLTSVIPFDELYPVLVEI